MALLIHYEGLQHFNDDQFKAEEKNQADQLGHVWLNPESACQSKWTVERLGILRFEPAHGACACEGADATARRSL